MLTITHRPDASPREGRSWEAIFSHLGDVVHMHGDDSAIPGQQPGPNLNVVVCSFHS